MEITPRHGIPPRRAAMTIQIAMMVIERTFATTMRETAHQHTMLRASWTQSNRHAGGSTAVIEAATVLARANPRRQRRREAETHRPRDTDTCKHTHTHTHTTDTQRQRHTETETEARGQIHTLRADTGARTCARRHGCSSMATATTATSKT